MWFHNEPQVGDWTLFTKSTPATGGLRGLAQGSMFSRDGTIIATMAQEGLVHH
jgi:acyl-CoA thioesterase-2